MLLNAVAPPSTMSEPSEAAPAEDSLVEAVGAAALPPEHDLIGAQMQPEVDLPDEANEQFWEAPIFARMTAISAQADATGVSIENVLSWSKPHYKGLCVYFSPEYKPSDQTSWSRLKTDLQESAADYGFSLVSKGAKGKSPADRLRQVLICARGRTVPQSRKANQSLRPTDPTECCRFRLTIHQDPGLDRYFIKGGQNNPMHKFHSKITQDECRPKKKRARDEYTQTSNAQAAQRQPTVAVAAPAPLENVVWHPTSLTRADRWKNHKGAVLWFTGLSACGKSSVANQVELLLSQRDIKTYLLDGDNLRHGLCSDLAFSEAERNENLRRTAEVAKLMAESGTVVLGAFVSPYESHRERVKSIVVEGDIPFVEIYVKASLETCEKRDPKGLYLKARSGQIPDFTGISHPYEEPVSPDIVLDAEKETIEALAIQVIHYLDIHGSLVVANENSEQVV